MRKVLLVLTMAALIAATAMSFGCRPRTKVRDIVLSEVIHSIFYAPQYVALHKGFFLAEGLNVRLEVAQGADRGAAALLSGAAQVALFGSEAAIYTWQQGALNPIIAFALLCQRDGSFLVGRTPDPDFTWRDVVGRTIIGGRRGGVPQMVLEYVLNEHGVTPQGDVTIIQNIGLGATAAAFAEGTGDYVQLWEPAASRLVNAGAGYIVAAMGKYSGVLPYTAFHATKTYMRENPDVILGFTRAIYRAQRWVQTTPAAEIAATIQPSFPDMALADMTAIIARYKELGVWATNPLIPREAFDHLQNIMLAAGELSSKAPFADVVNTEIAERVVNERR
ncbi:MAG: ABC transporter substrate-binding protein [Selenomonadales bacterium]|nr:ABC transporter substrate-binding protein [Selenomonadales bacterium]